MAVVVSDDTTSPADSEDASSSGQIAAAKFEKAPSNEASLVFMHRYLQMKVCSDHRFWYTCRCRYVSRNQPSHLLLDGVSKRPHNRYFFW